MLFCSILAETEIRKIYRIHSRCNSLYYKEWIQCGQLWEFDTNCLYVILIKNSNIWVEESEGIAQTQKQENHGFNRRGGLIEYQVKGINWKKFDYCCVNAALYIKVRRTRLWDRLWYNLQIHRDSGTTYELWYRRIDIVLWAT